MNVPYKHQPLRPTPYPARSWTPDPPKAYAFACARRRNPDGSDKPVTFCLRAPSPSEYLFADAASALLFYVPKDGAKPRHQGELALCPHCAYSAQRDEDVQRVLESRKRVRSGG